jgi:predicted Zn-dependent protease
VARNTLAEAHAAAPDDVVATQLYCEALLRAEDPAAAAELAESYAQRRPEHPLGYFLLAVVMERDGADQEAIEQYQLALQKDETFLDAHKNLAILCHTLSKTYSIRERTLLAYEHYKRYFELGGGDPSLKAMYDELLKYKDAILGSN